MWKLVRNRLLGVPFILLGLLTVTFLMTRGIASDPIYGVLTAREILNEDYVAQIRERYGLNDPAYLQYLKYLWNVVQGDLGVSFRTRQPVLDDLLLKVPATLELILAALTIAGLLGLVLGCIAAVFEGSLADTLIRVVSLVGSSVPVFWLALVLLYVGSVVVDLFPGPGRISNRIAAPDTITGFLLLDSALQGRWDAFRSAAHQLLLPSIVLAWSILGTITRLVRASMLDALESDFILLARAKGVPRGAIVVRHALRASLLSTITILAHVFGYLLTGAVLVEAIFAWPGLGDYAIASARALDYPAILGVTLVSGITFVLVNLVADILYAVADPRIQR